MGSKETGEDLVAGHLNETNDTTLIVACRRSENQVWDNNAKSILLVTPSSIVGDRPELKLDGILGIAQRGGAGVRGVGNQPDGRRGRIGSGNGGDGVVGQGGTGDLEWGIGFNQHPGIGVLGVGGIWTGPERVNDRDFRDQRGGAGVVGVAGGDQPPGPWVPPFDDTKGVGVYGISAVAEGMVAHGVSNGLRAFGHIGVKATGVNGLGVWAEGVIGLKAFGSFGPAGVFTREWNREVGAAPQVRIVPTGMAVPDAEDVETVSVLPPDAVDQLPRNAEVGALLMTIRAKPGAAAAKEPGAEATLWLCVAGSYGSKELKGEIVPAIWKQVLLGPPITGKVNNLDLGI